MKNRGIYLMHALDCIEKITRYTSTGEANFFSDEMIQDAVVRNFEVIGQCIKDYGVDDLNKSYPGMPWEEVAGMRNILAHEYLGVDLKLIWGVVFKDLSMLQEKLTELANKE